MTDSLILLNSIKYEDEEAIKTFVEAMAYRLRNRQDELLESVRGESIFTFNKGDQDKALKAIFLSLALSSINSNLYDPFLRNELIQKFRNVSTTLGIPYSDIVKLSVEEDRLRQVVEGFLHFP